MMHKWAEDQDDYEKKMHEAAEAKRRRIAQASNPDPDAEERVRFQDETEAQRMERL
jgi:hypothetical protein